MAKFKIHKIRAGFGVTIMPKNQYGGNILKYYFEPEVELEVPIEGEKEELAKALNDVCSEIITNIQDALRNKAKSDKVKAAEQKQDGAPG